MPPKRKRAVDSGGGRPAPHRPDQTTLGQHDGRGYQDGGARGGRSSRSGRRNDRRDSAQGASTSASSSNQVPPSPSVPRPSSASSQIAPPPPNTTAPVPAAPVPPPTSAVSSDYVYSIMTDTRVSTWAQGGRQEVVDYGVQSRDDEDATEVSTIFQELLRSVLDSRLDATDAGTAVKQIAGEPPEGTPADGAANAGIFDARMIFLDTISIFLDIEDNTPRPQLRDFMIATDIPPALMRQVLDHDFLMRLGLLRDTFHRMVIRHSTNLLYRQQSYNLLREETEGFSKLMTELYTSSTTAGQDFETAQATFERVKGLIGTFDLDVGRVLDIALDAFAATIIKQFKFFVKFLRISSWWPRGRSRYSTATFLDGLPRWAKPELADEALTEEEQETLLAEERLKRDVAFWDRARAVHLDAFFQLGGREVADAELLRLAADEDDEITDGNAELQWIKATKTLPPTGNRVAAQVLGFKLRFYSSQARSAADILPANLLYLAALLIKIGFISLCDLYPHLWPEDDKMQDVYDKRRAELAEKEKRSRPGGATNALMMAGALPDDMAPLPGAASRRDGIAGKHDASQNGADAAAATAAPKLPEPHDQKVQLLDHLLTIGALPEALFMLGRFPWLPEMFPDTLFPLIHRILLRSIHKVASDSQPVSSGSFGCPPKAIAETDQTGVPKGRVKRGELPLKRPLRWPFPDKSDVGEGQSYRFYFDEWIDNIPVCQNVDDIFTLCGTLLNVSGVNIGREPELLTSLANIGAKSLREDPSQHNRSRWQDLLKRLLVPALSLTPPNPSIVNAIWKLLRLYPLSVRYNIYAEWYEGSISRLEPIKKAFNLARLETLGTMKRLSLTNISAMARTLATTTYTSPGVVFRVALDQIEAYSNLIQVFVECAKYFTELGYDVLVWSLMSSLGGKQRSRTQETSVLLTSKWLQALSKFSGNVFKRYANMDPTPVIQYVNDQLFKGNSTDLVILKELIVSMGGLVSDVDFTDTQIQAMTGRKLLQRQTLINLQDRRFESTRSAARLMTALVDTKLAGQLLINIAQYRQSAIYKVAEDEAHIKLLATMVDDTHQILVQYLDLLRTNLEPDQFDSLVPDITHLMTDFGLDVSLAFMIGRAGLSAQLIKEKSPASQSQIDADGDVAMNGEKGPASVADASAPGNAAEDPMVLDDDKGSTEASGPVAAVNGRNSDWLRDVFEPLVTAVQTILPAEIWERVSPTFYVTFWSLHLGNISYPRANYETEMARLNQQSEEVMRDRTDMTRAGMNKKSEKRDALMGASKALMYEMIAHFEQNSRTKIRLIRHSKTWFQGPLKDISAVADIVLEQCILPRLLLSPVDTEYCFRMLKFLHDNKTPNFQLMAVYDRFFNSNRLRDLIFTCTVREAEHLGRFIKCILGDLSKWHADAALYETHGLGSKENQRTYLGFVKTFDDEGKAQSHVEHPQFRDLLYGWHKNLNIALKDCLESPEWMHIRNAITVLKTILEFFPAVDFMGRQFSDQLKRISEREARSKTASDSEPGHRVDLSVAAQTALSELQRRKTKWVIVQAFRPGGASKTQEETKAADSSASSLRPSAPEFKPQPQRANNNPARTQPVPEVEDGELGDGKAGAPSSGAPAASKGAVSSEKELLLPKKDNKIPTQATPTSKPSTPKPTHAIPAAPVPARSDLPKSSITSLPHPHSLPNRPDVPVPGHYSTDRFGQIRNQDRREPSTRDPPDAREVRVPRDPRDHRDSRDPRDPRDSLDPRELRTPDNALVDRPPRDFSGPGRRSEGAPRDASRHSDRDRPSREDAPPPRWPGHGLPERESRQPRERGPPPGRTQEARPPRDAAQGTPPPSAPPSQPNAQEALPINPDRARLIATDTNPERAPVIGDTRAPPSLRSARDESRDRVPSRPQSPRSSDRRNAESGAGDRSRDERHGRSHHQEPHPSGRDSHGHPSNAQPRDRNSDRDGDRAPPPPTDRSRDPAVRQPEPDHGRLTHQDPNYGRLNAIPSVTDIPSGPRGRGRDAARVSSMNGPPPRSDGRFPSAETHRAASPDRHPPTGPSSSRSSRRGRGGQFDSGPTLPSPTTGGPPPPATGVHPERARQINPAIPPPPPPPPPPMAPSFSGPPGGTPGIHPDRLGRIANDHSPRTNLPPLQTPDRPPLPTGPPGQRGPPASLPNPPGSGERTRNRSERLMKGIQDTLSGSGSSSSSRRGPGVRGHMAGSDAQVLTGGSPITTPTHERNDAARRELGADRPPPNEPGVPPLRDGRATNGDEFQGSGGRDHDRSDRNSSRREHRSDRSGRQSRRSSRERSPERERDPKSHREYRERRSDVAPVPSSGNARDAAARDAADRDAAPSRRSAREPANVNREPLGGSNRDANREPLGGGRESRHRGEGRSDGGGRATEEWSGAGSGGRSGRGGGGSGAPREGGLRPGDERRDNREDRGRKRRSEEGVGSLGSEREKRQRR